MEKNSPSSHEYEDVINLTELLRKLYNEKFKLILIIIFSIILGIVYITNLQKKDTFEFTLSIEPSHYSGFINIIPVTNYLYDNLFDNNNDEDLSGYEITDDYKELIFNTFMKEFMDYEEVISVLEKKKIIKEKISLFTKQKKEIALHNYAKSFYIQKINDKNDKTKIHYYLKYTWHNKDEGIEILDEILKLTINNLEKSFFSEMDNLLDIKRDQNAIEKLKQIDFLIDQREMAEELGISENTIDTIKLAQSSLVFNFSNDVDVYYYLRGYKMIDKEITLIRNRKDRKLENAEERIQEFKNEKQIEWIKYNINAIGIKSLNQKSIKIMIIFIISGLVLGIFYISITTSNLFLKIRKNN